VLSHSRSRAIPSPCRSRQAVQTLEQRHRIEAIAAVVRSNGGRRHVPLKGQREMSRTITLDAESEVLIEALLRDGGYATAEAVLHEALRRLGAEEAMVADLDIAAIRLSVEANRRDGRTVAASEVFDRLGAKYTALSREQAPQLRE
jgi:Arc/MetJ-type ribon-helix-helix transcriptional regulator